MTYPLEVADVFRAHGPAWRRAQHGHLSLAQCKVMSAITQCRSAALGGHVLACPACEHAQIAYNSCRNRHCPKCQASAAHRWLEAHQVDLLPIEYYHVVFTLPAPISAIAYTNKAVIYALLFQIAAETLRTIAADPRHLVARIGLTLVLHTWGSALTHHPHVHGIVPGGGLSPDGERWIACRPGFFLPVRVLSRLFRRRFLEALAKAHAAGQLQFFGEYAALADTTTFADWLKPLRLIEWVVYAKRPFASPAAVLAYLARYTHRVAIANSRLISLDEHGVTFKWKDYRAKGKTKHKIMTLKVGEFMRRFLLHVPIRKDNKTAQEKLELELLQSHGIELVVLARYMQIFSEQMITPYRNRIINIHHSMLPAFSGAQPYKQAHERGVKLIGATSHFVTEDLDEGPIIAQDVSYVNHRKNVEQLIKQGRDLEMAVLARAIDLYLNRRILVDRKRTIVFD